MIVVDREETMPYSATQLYDLVNDIERYPDFIPGCASVDVISRTDTETHACVRLTVAGFSEQISTRNYCEPPKSIRMVQTGNSLQNFSGSWRFEDCLDGCLVRIYAQLELRSRMLNALANRFSAQMTDRMIEVLRLRAEQLYGQT